MKEIKGYDYKYYVDEYGAMLRESKTGELIDMKSHIRVSGNHKRECVTLVKDGKPCVKSIHRLMMMVFNPVDNMDELQVDHINQDSTDNRLTNLRWVTDMENQYNRPKHMQPKPLLCTNKITNEVLNFQSIRATANYFKTNEEVVKRATQGRSRKFSEWEFKFI